MFQPERMKYLFSTHFSWQAIENSYKNGLHAGHQMKITSRIGYRHKVINK